MEPSSLTGLPLSALAQRILEALRAQHADRAALRRQRSVPSSGDTGGGDMLRRTQEEGRWSGTQQRSVTGDQRGAGRSWCVGHPGDYQQEEGIRDRSSLLPYGCAPELGRNSRSGRGPYSVCVPLAPPGPSEDGGGIRGDAASPGRESEARKLLLQSDIINVGGAEANCHAEREGSCRLAGQGGPALGAVNHPVCRAGPQGGQWRFGRLLLPPWNCVSKEGEEAGLGKLVAESEKELTKELVDRQTRSNGERAWPVGEVAFPFPGDGLTQAGDRAERGRCETLQFGCSSLKDGVVEDLEERRCRQGVLLGTRPISVQGGFRVTSSSRREAALTETECIRNPVWRDTGGGDQLETFREEDKTSQFKDNVLQEDHLVCYREEQVGGYGEKQVRGYREERPGGHREEEPGNYREEETRCYREEDTGCYREEETGCYREEETKSYREKHPGAYSEEETESFREKHTGAYSEEATKSYREEATKSYSKEHPGAYREEATKSYREEATKSYREEATKSYREEATKSYREEATKSYREEATKSYREEATKSYREEQAGGFREEQAAGFKEEEAGGHREKRAESCRVEQAGEFREEQAGGYREELAGGYREEQAGGCRKEEAGGHREEQARGYWEEQAVGFKEEQAESYRVEQAGGFRKEQAAAFREEEAGGHREEQAGGYREILAGGSSEGQAECYRVEQAAGSWYSERDPLSGHQDNRDDAGSAAVCPWLTDGHMETSNQDGPNDASQVRTGHGDSSEAAGISGGRPESVVDLALKSSCPIKTPTSNKRKPPPASTTGSSRPNHSQSLPHRGNSQGTTNQVAPLKRRHASSQPNGCGAKKPGRWEPPRPSQERSRGVSQTAKPPAPSSATEAHGKKGLNPHGGVGFKSHSPPRQQPPTKPLKPFKEVLVGLGEKGQETHPRKEGLEPSWAMNSDPAVREASRFSPEEKAQAMQEFARASALVLTMVYQDGSTQLCPKQKLPLPSVCGVLVLLKQSVDPTGPEQSQDPTRPEQAPDPGDSLIFLRLEQRPAWAQQDLDQNQDLFTREVVQRMVSADQVVVCYKAKDLLRSLLRHFRGDLSWKQVAHCRILDPQIAAWLLDPSDPASCFQDLVTKHCRTSARSQTSGSGKASNLGASLSLLHQLMMELCSKLKTQGLWELFSGMELSMIPVLAAMESHRIHVDKEALKRTSEMLGVKLKQLEQEAHKAAGQQFLVSSSTQLRLVLFEKLRLQDRCENRKLPKTVLKQQQSTSEAVLLQLQDLHPLPRIILEYRQVHKIKSTFVDGILSCMKKAYVSPTWNQTSTVSGRLSAKQPNFQALPRQPVQISKKQYISGKLAEVETVHPRDMFIPQEGHTFLAADFCQVELRLLAHLTSDPELLRLFQDPDADVFTMLASQWKGVPEDQLNAEDREHAKRIVYSVVYGAGRERLSGILGVSAEQASRFVDSFLQRYGEVQNFIQRTIQQCQKQGFVVSIMGRRRSLPHIRSADWAVRNQAERQAVNFVLQGSAADLCKMAMIRISSLVSSSSSLTPRLLAQIHDELLFEVEDSQVEDFTALVQKTMESLQHIDLLGVHLKVPLKVAVSSGRSWGSMSELHLPPSASAPVSPRASV